MTDMEGGGEEGSPPPSLLLSFYASLTAGDGGVEGSVIGRNGWRGERDRIVDTRILFLNNGKVSTGNLFLERYGFPAAVGTDAPSGSRGFEIWD